MTANRQMKKAGEPALPNKRGALTQKFIADLEAQWRVYGPEILDKVREESPTKFAEICARLIPLQTAPTEEDSFGLKQIRSLDELKAHVVNTIIEMGFADHVLAALRQRNGNAAPIG